MKKIYTCRKTNSAGQRAIDCLDYCCLGIDETCMRLYDEPDYILTRCKVRLGEVCEYFRAGGG